MRRLLFPVELHSQCGRGVRPSRLCELHAPGQSPFCRDESRPDNWCPRKDSNLQPLVCRTSAQSVELLGREMVVGVGIEPTFRVFQTRANPSQLSDLGARGETRTHEYWICNPAP